MSPPPHIESIAATVRSHEELIHENMARVTSLGDTMARNEGWFQSILKEMETLHRMLDGVLKNAAKVSEIEAHDLRLKKLEGKAGDSWDSAKKLALGGTVVFIFTKGQDILRAWGIL